MQKLRKVQIVTCPLSNGTKKYVKTDPYFHKNGLERSHGLFVDEENIDDIIHDLEIAKKLLGR